MDGKPVMFTLVEIEGLEQIVSAGHKWLDGTNPAYPNLILKVGRAFLEAQNGGKHQELYLSEVEAWYLREIVSTNMRTKGEPVGLTIKKKLYPLILDFEAERYSGAAGNEYGFSVVDEPLTKRDADIERDGQEPDALPDGDRNPWEPDSIENLRPDDVEETDHTDPQGVDTPELDIEQPT